MSNAEYKDSFLGLVASDLPEGEFEAAIRCREARIETSVKVNEADRFAVVSEHRRVMRSHPMPHLVIRGNSADSAGETWWVTLRALYAERSYTAKFQSETGEAYIADPDTGSYPVNILSTAGYNCTRDIDLSESTRLWTFDPVGCTFRLDSFAHLVTAEDKRDLKSTDWYRRSWMRDEGLFRALEKAAKASADPNSKE